MTNKERPILSDLTKQLKAVKAEDIMTHYVITTTEDVHLADVSEMMAKARISGLPVLDKKGKIAGMITATDLFIMMDMIKSGDIVENGFINIPNLTVKSVMSTEVNKIKKSTTLDEIIVIMKCKNVHTLPVLESGKLVGIIGRRDVFKNFYAVVKKLEV